MLLTWADDILRGRPEIVEAGSTRKRLIQLAAVLCLAGWIYGAVMGSFAGVFGERFWQVVYSALKVPLLLLVTFCLSMPFFFVLNTLFGLRDDFRRVLRALLATQAGLTLILASLSPLTILWYVSYGHYQTAILFNAFMFGFAALTAQFILKQYYKPLIRKSHIHARLLKVWVVIYGFVAIQTAWVLRPFIGDPESPVQFFRENAWGNAYIQLFEIALSLLR